MDLSPFAPNKIQKNLFFQLVYDGRVEAVQHRLALEPRWARQSDPTGFTPLMLALQHRSVDCALALVPHSDAHATNKHGETALMLAAFHQAPLPLLDALLAAGMDPQARMPDGHTALSLAFLQGNLDAARLLAPLSSLELVPDQDHRKTNALLLAMGSSLPACFDLLVPFIDTPLLEQYHANACELFSFAAETSPEALRQLMRLACQDQSSTAHSNGKGATLNKANTNGAQRYAPLAFLSSAARGHSGALRLFLGSGFVFTPQTLAQGVALFLRSSSISFSLETRGGLLLLWNQLVQACTSPPLERGVLAMPSRPHPISGAAVSSEAPKPEGSQPVAALPLCASSPPSPQTSASPFLTQTLQAVFAGEPDGNILLHLAATAGVLHQLPELLSLGQPDQRNAQGQTVLMLAARQGDRQQLQHLLDYPAWAATLEAVDLEGRNALMHAALSGSAGVLDLLLPRARLGLQDHSGQTALGLGIKALLTEQWLKSTGEEIDESFAQLGRLYCVRSLLDHPQEHRAPPLRTPLMLALRAAPATPLAPLCQMLDAIEASDPHLREHAYDAQTLLLAYDCQRHSLVERLLSSGPMRRTASGQTALMLAVQSNRIKAATFFLSHDDPQAQDAYGMNALMIATHCNHERMTQLLLPVSDLSATNMDGDTALLLALRPPADCFSHLIQRDAMGCDAEGNTPLMVAAMAGVDQIPLFPLDTALAQNHKGQTALMLAAEQGHLKVLTHLLPASDAAAQDAQGRMAVDYAFLGGRQQLLPSSRTKHLFCVEALAADTPQAHFFASWQQHVEHFELNASARPSMPLSETVIERVQLAQVLTPSETDGPPLPEVSSPTDTGTTKNAPTRRIRRV